MAEQIPLIKKLDSGEKKNQNRLSPPKPQPGSISSVYNYNYSIVSKQDEEYYDSKEIKVKKIIRKLS